MNTGPKLFAWDFHGTLEQGTEVGFADILKILTREFGIKKKIHLKDVRRLFGASITAYLKHFFPKTSVKTIEAMRTRIAEVQNQEHLAKFVTVAPYAKEILTKIRRTGHKNIVVSNSHSRHIEMWIETVGLDGLFDEVFALDRHNKAFNVDMTKEKAKAIKSFAQKHRIAKNNIVVVGDRATDINAGLLVGATTYQYVRRGFTVDKTNAHFKISDLRDVLKEI